MGKRIAITLIGALVLTLLSSLFVFTSKDYYPGSECSGGVCQAEEKSRGVPLAIAKEQAVSGPLDGVQYQAELKPWALVLNAAFWFLVSLLGTALFLGAASCMEGMGIYRRKRKEKRDPRPLAFDVDSSPNSKSGDREYGLKGKSEKKSLEE